MNHEKKNVLGMEMEVWTHESCEASFATGGFGTEPWATLFSIKSKEEGKGHATALLKEAKAHYEGQGFKFGGSVALNERMRSIYQRLGIKEYTYAD